MVGIIMLHLLSMITSLLRPRRGAWLLLAAVVLLSGCCSPPNLRGDNFADDSLASQARGRRQTDKDNETWGVTTKGRQIEKDLGVNSVAQ
jgi:hypothetical protein